MKYTFEHNRQLGHTTSAFQISFSKVKKIWTWAGRRRQNCLAPFWFFSSNIYIWISKCSEQYQDQREEVWWWCLAWNTGPGSPNLSVYKNKYNTILSIYISRIYPNNINFFFNSGQSSPDKGALKQNHRKGLGDKKLKWKHIVWNNLWCKITIGHNFVLRINIFVGPKG